jgi:ribonuclease J
MTARLSALGGLGEFGANAMLVTAGGTRLLIDVGAAFSDHSAFGVAFEVPDFASLGGPPPVAIVVTHAHDDHVKALPYALTAWPDAAVLANRTTLVWARELLADHPAASACELRDGVAHRIDGFSLELLPVSHSIPGTSALRVRADAGTLVSASDLRLTPSALDEHTSTAALAQWGAEGVDGLLLDATNALVDHEPPSEATVAAGLAEQIAAARGLVVVVSFASHLGRFRQAALAAAAAGRVVVPIGRGVLEALAVGQHLGSFVLPVGLLRPARDLRDMPRDRVVVVASGSQGEPPSAFARLAVGQLAEVKLQKGDLVLHAARVIPGNERRLASLFDHCVRSGARVVTAGEAPIHASGHPHRAELETLIDLVRPRWVLPIHGRRRNLEEVAALAGHHGVASCVVENGAELEWDRDRLAPTGATLGVERLLVADSSSQMVAPRLVKERRTLARNGLAVVTLTLGGPDGASILASDLQTSGIALAADDVRRLLAALAAELRHSGALAKGDDEARSTISKWLRAELRRSQRQQPIVLTSLVREPS